MKILQVLQYHLPAAQIVNLQVYSCIWFVAALLMFIAGGVKAEHMFTTGNGDISNYWDKKKECMNGVAQNHELSNPINNSNVYDIRIRAFIPNDLSVVQHSLEGEVAYLVNPLGRGFSTTDQRGFSEDLNQTARLTFHASFNVQENTITTDSWSDCTFHIDRRTGNVVQRGIAIPYLASENYHRPNSQATSSKGLRTVFQTRAGQPLLPESVLGPIRMEGRITLWSESNSIDLELKLSPFPSMEILLIHQGKIVSVKQISPGNSDTPMKLFWDGWDPDVEVKERIPLNK